MASTSELLTAGLQAIKDVTAALTSLEAGQKALHDDLRDLRDAIDRMAEATGRHTALEEHRSRARSETFRFFEKVVNSKVGDLAMKALILLALGANAGSSIFPELFHGQRAPVAESVEPSPDEAK